MLMRKKVLKSGAKKGFNPFFKRFHLPKQNSLNMLSSIWLVS